MSCCQLSNGKFSKAKTLLVLTNFIFALVGAVVLGASAYVSAHSDWKDLFETDSDSYSLIYFMMALGASILFISALGMFGAIKESKCLLSFYLLIVFSILAAQIFVAAVFSEFNDTVSDIADDKFHVSYGDLEGFQKDVTKQIARSTTFIYENGDCTTTVDSTTDLQITCSAPKSEWFENFVNDKCTPESGVWEFSKMEECRDFSMGMNSADAINVWCKCKTVIGAEINEYSKALAGIAIGVAVLEFLLLLCAIRMVCCYKKVKKDDDYEDYQAQRTDGSKPKSGAGVNMV